jgi:hypothetical protein
MKADLVYERAPDVTIKFMKWLGLTLIRVDIEAT